MGSAEQELGAGSFGWFPRPGSSPGPPWNAHRGADSAGRSHASGVRLSRAWSHPGAQDATVLAISELGNPEHLDNGALSLSHCSWHSAPLLCPPGVWGLVVAYALKHTYRAVGLEKV